MEEKLTVHEVARDIVLRMLDEKLNPFRNPEISSQGPGEIPYVDPVKVAACFTKIARGLAAGWKLD